MPALSLPQHLLDRKHVLIAGAGGGFDVYAGIPLGEALRARGVRVTFANLSFSAVSRSGLAPLVPGLYKVDADTEWPSPYFPEGSLCRFYRERGEELSIYTFEKAGVRPLLEAYEEVVAREAIDAVVLVDGGTDILMRGDESGLGTPVEDMTSLAAVHMLDIDTKLVACLGFGVDSYHGVCHAHVLENVAALSRRGAFLGAQSLLPEASESEIYLDAVRHAERQMSTHPSIVNTSIASALEGAFGDVHRTSRTRGSELFINPLMSMYWTFELRGLVSEHLYLESLLETESVWDVQLAIEAYRHGVTPRPRKAIPH